MIPVSPFSLFEGLLPAAKVIGSIAGDVAERAQGKGGLAGAFADAYSDLDANDDGRLNGADVLGHAVGLRDAVLEGVADLFGVETAGNAARGLGPDTNPGSGQAGSEAIPPAQILLSGAPPALPSAPAARAVENLPGVDEIRATYLELGQIH